MKVNMHIIMHVGYRMSMYIQTTVHIFMCHVCKYALALVSTCVHENILLHVKKLFVHIHVYIKFNNECFSYDCI